MQDDCESSFSTDPGRLQLYIPEILEYFPDSYPLEAMMYAPGEDAEDLPAHLTTDCVSLTHTSIESVIIATTHWGEEEEGEWMWHVGVEDDIEWVGPFSGWGSWAGLIVIVRLTNIIIESVIIATTHWGRRVVVSGCGQLVGRAS